jgi:uncharacterized oxidoreductase
MKLTGNTILITGGGSGIGRGLAEALHILGNQVIISGRRKAHLDETAKANPGMKSLELDVGNPANIKAVAAKLIGEYPKFNVLINNAGVMHIDDVSVAVDEGILLTTITTNLMGPVRMTAAFIDHLKKQDRAVVMNLSSVLGFVPMSMAAVYSTTKAALHSYSLSLRYKLKDTSVKVLEIVPPWVATDLLNSRDNPNAMAVHEFIAETIKVLGTDEQEVLVNRAKPLRNNVGPNEGAFVTQFNDRWAQLTGPGKAESA